MSTQNLADIMERLHRERQSGVLSISVRNDNNQFKFFFREGTVYYVTYSTCRNLECVVRLNALVADRGFFLPGVKVEPSHALTLSTPEILARVRALNKTIEWGRAQDPAQAGPTGDAMVLMVPDAQVGLLEEELLTLVGPVGSILFQHAADLCKVVRGAAITKKNFQELVQVIANQMPEEQRKTFLAKHAF